jgi:hypothetical protein
MTGSELGSEESGNIPDAHDPALLSLSMQAFEQLGHEHNTSNHLTNLCSTRIAVYVHSGVVRAPKPRRSTIAAVVHIGTQYYALTVAHVFFERVDASKSWTDSGLYTTSESSVENRSEVPVPRSSNMYEIIVESVWPHDNAQGGAESESSVIGLVAPLLSLRRRNSVEAALPVVIWNAELDWALIELKRQNVLKPNSIITSMGADISLSLPPANVRPPNNEVFIAAGVSREAIGFGSGSVGKILLPWPSQEIEVWSVEAEMGISELSYLDIYANKFEAIGDSGSLAICLETGMVYGLVVAYDSDTLMIYVILIISVFESIFAHFELAFSSDLNVFSNHCGIEDAEESSNLPKSVLKIEDTTESSFMKPMDIYDMFL